MNISTSIPGRAKDELYIFIAELIKESVLFLLHLFDESEQIDEFAEFTPESKIINKWKKIKKRSKIRMISLVERKLQNIVQFLKSDSGLARTLKSVLALLFFRTLKTSKIQTH